MSDDNLKRPPTLFTIVSSLNSSCTGDPSTTEKNFTNLLHRAIQIIIDDLVIIHGSPLQLPASCGQSSFDFLFAVRTAPADATLILIQRAGLEEDHQAVGIGLLHGHSALD